MSADKKATKKDEKRVKPRFRRTDLTNTAPDDVTAAALDRKELALASAALGDSRYLHHMMLQFHHQVPTTDVDTMATARFADGDNVFMINPEFTMSLETTECVQFILDHEVMHPLLGHTRDRDDFPNDQTMVMAQEIVINAVILARRRDAARMPHQVKVNKAGNTVVEPTGIDPREVYHKTYLVQCQEAGLTPVSYAKFTETEMSCYTELKRLPNPPGSPGNEVVIVCSHGQLGDGDGNGNGQSSETDEALDEAVKQAIQATITDARNGSEKAKAQILALAEMTEGESEKAKKMWGDYGLNSLRGKTDSTRVIAWWERWLGDVLASKLVPGEKLIFPKKRTGMLLALDEDPLPVRRGNELQATMAVFNDRSASVSERTTQQINKLVGRIPGVEVDWYDFDGIVQKHVPGEGVHGGGGTNFQNCVDVVEGRYLIDGDPVDKDYDVVIMVTDGFAPKVRPVDPDRWIWLIVENGDDWPDHQNPPMETHYIDTAEAAAEA